MKISLMTTLLISLFIATPALADKPEWAGKGRPTAEQREAHKETMTQKQQGGNGPSSLKGTQHEREYDRNERHDPKDEAERLKQQAPIENAHEAIHDVQQVNETVETVNKWYEFWKR